MRETIYLDIETLPAPAEMMAEIEVTPPANYKKPESIEKWLAEEGEARRRDIWERTALDGWQGRICVAAWAIGDGPVHSATGDEASILRDLFGYVRGDVLEFCGHHVAFDLEFIKRRAVMLGVRLPFAWPVNRPSWDGSIRCTMALAVGHQDRISLATLCQRLGIEVADDIDGSQVRERWEAGDHEAVVRHCVADVERVRQVDRMFRRVGIE